MTAAEDEAEWAQLMANLSDKACNFLALLPSRSPRGKILKNFAKLCDWLREHASIMWVEDGPNGALLLAYHRQKFMNLLEEELIRDEGVDAATATKKVDGKFRSFERKLKDDLDMRVQQRTHAKEPVKKWCHVSQVDLAGTARGTSKRRSKATTGKSTKVQRQRRSVSTSPPRKPGAPSAKRARSGARDANVGGKRAFGMMSRLPGKAGPRGDDDSTDDDDYFGDEDDEYVPGARTPPKRSRSRSSGGRGKGTGGGGGGDGNRANAWGRSDLVPRSFAGSMNAYASTEAVPADVAEAAASLHTLRNSTGRDGISATDLTGGAPLSASVMEGISTAKAGTKRTSAGRASRGIASPVVVAAAAAAEAAAADSASDTMYASPRPIGSGARSASRTSAKGGQEEARLAPETLLAYLDMHQKSTEVKHQRLRRALGQSTGSRQDFKEGWSLNAVSLAASTDGAVGLFDDMHAIHGGGDSPDPD